MWCEGGGDRKSIVVWLLVSHLMFDPKVYLMSPKPDLELVLITQYQEGSGDTALECWMWSNICIQLSTNFTEGATHTKVH